MNAVLEPILKDALTRYTKFNKPEARDAVRILGPALEAICLDAKAPAARAGKWLQTQSPEGITAESVQEFVRSVTEAPAEELERARLRQAQIEAEIAAEGPLPADAQERHLPITERSRTALEMRIARLRVHGGDAARKEWESLEDELDKRECLSEGLPWEPRFRLNATGRALSAVMPMRG